MVELLLLLLHLIKAFYILGSQLSAAAAAVDDVVISHLKITAPETRAVDVAAFVLFVLLD